MVFLRLQIWIFPQKCAQICSYLHHFDRILQYFFFSGLKYILVNWSLQKIARILYLVKKNAKFVPI